MYISKALIGPKTTHLFKPKTKVYSLYWESRLQMGLNPYILILAYINISIHTSLKKNKSRAVFILSNIFLKHYLYFFSFKKRQEIPNQKLSNIEDNLMLSNRFLRYLLMIYISDSATHHGILLTESSAPLNMSFFNARNGMLFSCSAIDSENAGICLNTSLNAGLGFFNY